MSSDDCSTHWIMISRAARWVQRRGVVWRGGSEGSSPFIEEAPRKKLRLESPYHLSAAGGHRSS